MQFLPSTWASRWDRRRRRRPGVHHRPGRRDLQRRPTRLRQPAHHPEAGIAGDPIALMFAAYNAGLGTVLGCRCLPDITQTHNYVSSILAIAPTLATPPARQSASRGDWAIRWPCARSSPRPTDRSPAGASIPASTWPPPPAPRSLPPPRANHLRRLGNRLRQLHLPRRHPHLHHLLRPPRHHHRRPRPNRHRRPATRYRRRHRRRHRPPPTLRSPHQRQDGRPSAVSRWHVTCPRLSIDCCRRGHGRARDARPHLGLSLSRPLPAARGRVTRRDTGARVHRARDAEVS